MIDIAELMMRYVAPAFTNGLWPGTAPDQQPAPYGTFLHFGPLNNFLQGRAGDQNQRTQIDVYAATYDEASRIADAVDAIMASSSIEYSPPGFTSTPLSREYFGLDQDVLLHRFMLEYSVWYRVNSQ